MAKVPDVFSSPMSVMALSGTVVVTGPDGLDASLTPQAARDSARRLLEAADEAEANPVRREDDFL